MKKLYWPLYFGVLFFNFAFLIFQLILLGVNLGIIGGVIIVILAFIDAIWPTWSKD